MDLEQQIEEANSRIDFRSKEIDLELVKINTKIRVFSNWAWGFVVFGILISVVGVWVFVCKNSETGFGLNLIGDFMAGTVASVWSLAGLFFIYVAFLGQKQQLLNQQLELMYSQLEVKYTRLELSGQKEEMKLQNETLKQQRFENTFFQQLSLFNNIVNNIDLRDTTSNKVTTTGRDCFKVFHRRFRTLLLDVINEKKQISNDFSSATIDQVIIAYDDFYGMTRADLSHYFRTLYHIIKFIDRSEIRDKSQYISMARAQLSSHEQIMLFYNCLHSNGKDKFKPLIEKYAILKNIDRAYIVKEDLLNAYDRSAYGE